MGKYKKNESKASLCYIELEASLGYVKLCLKEQSNTTDSETKGHQLFRTAEKDGAPINDTEISIKDSRESLRHINAG